MHTFIKRGTQIYNTRSTCTCSEMFGLSFFSMYVHTSKWTLYYRGMQLHIWSCTCFPCNSWRSNIADLPTVNSRHMKKESMAIHLYICMHALIHTISAWVYHIHIQQSLSFNSLSDHLVFFFYLCLSKKCQTLVVIQWGFFVAKFLKLLFFFWKRQIFIFWFK